MILESLIMAFFVHAKEALPECSFQGLKKYCEIFQKNVDQKTISLADGSIINNPLFEAKLAEVKQSNQTYQYESAPHNGYLKFQPKEIERSQKLQAQIFEVLDTSDFTTRFKLAYLDAVVGMQINPNGNVMLSWPPDGEDSRLETLPVKDVNTKMIEELGESEFVKLQSLAKELATPQFKVLEEYEREKRSRVAQELEQTRAAEKYQAVFTAKKKRILELFDYAKQQIVEVILKGRNRSKISEAEERMLTKVESVAPPNLDDPSVASSGHCPIESVNAFYDPIEHKINLCPSMVLTSESQIVFTLAHELGHAIDPCGFSMPFYRVKKNIDPKFWKSLADPSIEETMKGQFVNEDIALDINDQSELSKIQELVLDQKYGYVSPATYPMLKEMKCFRESTSFKFHSPEDSAYLDLKFKKALEKVPSQTKRRAKSTIRRYQKALDKYPECLKTYGPNSEMQEVMADVFGSLVTEKFYADHRERTTVDRGELLPFAEVICRETKKQDVPSDSVAPRVLESVIESSQKTSHPEYWARLEKIFLSLPSVAEVFQCQPTQVGCIRHLSLVHSESLTRESKVSTEPEEVDLNKGVR